MSKDYGYSDSKADRQGSRTRELEKKLEIVTADLVWMLEDGNRPIDDYYGSLFASDIRAILKYLKN